jgi:5'-deoxynucleotidase YfbR-like HD superfamily hydrolase
MNYQEILDGLLKQLTDYSKVHRRNTQPFTLTKLREFFPNYQSHVEDHPIRETLLEHVGSLPIVAAYLHPYLDQPVDLGKTLSMLAIHDIGELLVGDEITFTKAQAHDQAEQKAALELLHPVYHDLYNELTACETNEARYYKSIDKLLPDLYDYLNGAAYAQQRYKQQLGWEVEQALDNVRRFKIPFMKWSKFLTSLHQELFSRYKL